MWVIVNKFMGFVNLTQGYYKALEKGQKAQLDSIKNFDKMQKAVTKLDMAFSGNKKHWTNLLDVAAEFEEKNLSNAFGLMGKTGLEETFSVGKNPIINRYGSDISAAIEGDRKKQVQYKMEKYIPQYEMLKGMDIGGGKKVSDDQAMEFVLSTLKPLAKQKKLADKLMNREMRLFTTKSKVMKWMLKIKYKVTDFFSSIGGFIKGGLGLIKEAAIFLSTYGILIAMAVMTIIKFGPAVYKKIVAFIDRNRETFKVIKDTVIELGTAIYDLFTAIFAGDFGAFFSILFMKIYPLLFRIMLNVGKIIAHALWDVGTWVGQLLLDGIKWVGNQIISWLKSMWAKSPTVRILRWFSETRDERRRVTSNPPLVRFAAGGLSMGGMAVVGERGAELVNLPRGARVYSNAASNKMMATTININVSGHMGTSDAEIRLLADRLGKEINQRMNRTGATGIGF
jgi:hypothetical protein